MRILRQLMLVSLAAFTAAAISAACLAAQCRDNQRRVTVADTIQMNALVPPEAEGASSFDRTGLFSPDRKHFALLVSKGDLRNNTNRYTLLIFDTRNAFLSGKPEAFLRMSSSSNRPAIRDLRWLEDNHTVLFIGEPPRSLPAIYSFDISNRVLAKRTAYRTAIVDYGASDDGSVIVFEADPPGRDIVNDSETRRHGFVISGQDLSTILLSGERSAESMALTSRELYVQMRDGEAKKIRMVDGIWPVLTLSVAPNGKYALVEVFASRIPHAWLEYKNRILHEFAAAHRQSEQPSYVETYLLLDTRTAKISSLINTPKDWRHDGILWIDGGHSLIVSNSYLPLAGAMTPAERDVRERQPFVVEIALPSRSITPIGTDPLVAARWNPVSRDVVLENREKPRQISIYRNHERQWTRVLPVPDSATIAHVQLSIQQGMNTPPTVWISNPISGQARLLLNLNPQFAQLCFGWEREINWPATDGRSEQGGLYLPPDYEEGQRYPLVIQTHGFDPTRFWIDGPWSSAFAAQPLAAKDIVVLQIGYDEFGRSTPEEGPRQMAAFEGAIRYLSNAGIVDADRVGIIGFSRTVYHVAYSLTHSKIRFAAATLADGFDGGYFQAIASPSAAADADAVNGGAPYGSGLQLWMARSPDFNVAHLSSPVRLEAYGMASTIGEWEWYSLLSQMKRPIDYILLPDATHLLVRPWDRMTSLQGNVDWFCFWLRGEADPAPGKSAQYDRWRQLRVMQESNKEAVAGSASHP